MINRLLYHLQRPERGWDPVSRDHAITYASNEWDHFSPRTVDALEKRVGSLAEKSVLDLGGGPGQFSIEFARRGARVTWHDISHNYLDFFKDKIAELPRKDAQTLDIRFSIGYLEDALRLGELFDLVFCRIAWLYCLDDRRFAEIICRLIKPGGFGYLVINHTGFSRKQGLTLLQSFQIFLNERLGVKIGHPNPSSQKIRTVFSRIHGIETDFSEDEDNIEVLVRKLGNTPLK